MINVLPGDLYIFKRDIEDALIICHFRTETGVVFQLWANGNFWPLTEMPWDAYQSYLEQGRLRPVVFTQPFQN